MSAGYLDDPYRREAEATVTRVDGEWVQLDSPLLFAFSGGQQSDDGEIADRRVLEAQALDDGGIRYRLDAGHGLEPGARVRQVVDWDKRYRVMRVHAATHVAYAALCEVMGGARPLIGSNVHAAKGRLDYELEEPIGPVLPAAAERVAEIVGRDLPVARFADPPGSDRWTWELRGDDLDLAFWRMPCGGTHVARTGEIGAVRLKRKNIGSGKERVEVTLVG